MNVCLHLSEQLDQGELGTLNKGQKPVTENEKTVSLIRNPL